MDGLLTPGLFGQKYSNRDYSKAKYWGKNQFNSSFPASLVAYMWSKGIEAVYLCSDRNGNVRHDKISGEEILGINPLSDDAFYNFESGFPMYEQFYKGNREKIDLVMINRSTNEAIRGLEIKLTALPDMTTNKLPEEEYGCEIVMRPPTICFLACSICLCYKTSAGRGKLQRLLNSGIPKIKHWEDESSVAPYYESIKEAILAVAKDLCSRQTPLIVQPVWKTKGTRMILAEDCLDVFVWSNLAILRMCMEQKTTNYSINRFARSIIWIYRMLFDYAVYGTFDYVDIIRNHSYGTANDKAFALSGRASYSLMKCDELKHPRISKEEIKNIILGGGQNLLSPERRFDAVLVNSPEIF